MVLKEIFATKDTISKTKKIKKSFFQKHNLFKIFLILLQQILTALHKLNNDKNKNF